ncbi:cobyrinate a,c-diamide synthase [Intrasporangium flavum]|uniref:cobyrinate a,c-diamide synthase n=1 Tax=Intrasporangium flavum TaxID=1428657 RepID=UPI001F60D973|nr:cobyrinate a,c-diamide synthase [Intrasporangium flavum]
MSALDAALGRLQTADPTPPPTATRLPRLVVAAPGSGHGKTTVATGLMAALRGRGLGVAGLKVGPDYIDPGYHELATGRPGRNLDPFLCGEHRVEPLLLHAGRGADVAVVEGVMGLFDGRLGTEGFASTAHVAALTSSPLVLAVDVSNTTRTAAAIVHGLATFDPRIRVAGVVLNKAASGRHLREVWSAVETSGVAVLGVLPRDAGIEAPSRHLGLVPAAERDEAAAAVERLGERVASHVDLDAVLSIARSAPDLTGTPWDAAAEVGAPATDGPRPVVAVAGGRAFTFRYAETEELLRAAGLEPVVVDPTRDASLPAGTAGLFLGGGFPEVHAEALAANTSLLEQVRDAVLGGLPTVAECAGLLYLCESLDGDRMAGVLPAVASMGPRLTMGYRSAVAPVGSVVAEPGHRVTGHEFHRTTVTTDAGDVAAGEAAWLLDGQPEGFALDPAGTGRATLHASYLHTHWAGHPGLAARFAASVHEFASLRAPVAAGSRR